MNKEVIDWLDFGKVSAERDENLTNYFFDAGVLSKVISTKNDFLVLGRKGAGKTAVFRYLNDNANNLSKKKSLLVASLSLEDYNWNVHNQLMDVAKAESLTYIQSWKFIILQQAISELDGHFKKQMIDRPPSLKKAGKLIENLFGSPIPTLTQVVGAKLLQLSKVRLPSFATTGTIDDGLTAQADGGEVSFAEFQASPALREKLSNNLETIIGLFEKAISDIVNGPLVYITFDRVDEAWDADSIDSSRRLITGLVAAAESINSRFSSIVRPIIFLREDIFSVLPLNDKNKLKTDCGELLAWSAENLEKMVLKRVNFFGAGAGFQPIQTLDTLFDKDKMRQGRNPTSYIILRTMMRPRDAIRFLTLVLQDMRERRDDSLNNENVNTEKLECQAVYNAEAGYSEWLKEEIIDEWRAQRPDIVQYLSALQNHGLTVLSKKDLFAAMSKLAVGYKEDDLVETLRFLFNNSILGFRLGNSQQWRFKCLHPSQGFVESEQYKVHYGLIRGLNLREPRSVSDVDQ